MASEEMNTELLVKILAISLLLASTLRLPSICSGRESAQSEAPISLHQVSVTEGITERAFGDFDGDGIEEFLQTTGDGAVILDFDGKTPEPITHIQGGIIVSRIRTLDFTGDQYPEIFLSFKNESSSWTEVWGCIPSFGKAKYIPFLKTGLLSCQDLNNDGDRDIESGDYQVLDVNGDGQLDVLAGISTGYDRDPRGLFAFDGKTGRTIWSFPTAGQPYTPVCTDVNGDGEAEILLGSWAPCNGRGVEGMDDCRSYLICLNSDGDLLWKVEVGGVFSQPAYVLSDLEHDGRVELICKYMSGGHGDKSTRFEIQIRDAGTGGIKKHLPLQADFGQLFLSDFNRDGVNEIVITDTDGWIRVFNHNLKGVMSTRLGTSLQPCLISQIVDIGWDGEQEVIACSSNRLFILNSRLQILKDHRTDMSIRPRSVHLFKHPYYGEIISLIEGRMDKLTRASFLEVTLEKSAGQVIAIRSKYGWTFLLIIFALGISVGLVGIKLVPGLIRRVHIQPEQRLDERRERLLETMSAFGHGKAATANLDRLNFLFKNLTEGQLLSLEFRKKLDETIDTYFDFTLSKLVEIIRRAKPAEVGKESLESLEGHLKKLEDHLIQYRDRRGVEENQAEVFSRAIPELLESIDGDIESIRSELTRFYSCDVVHTIEEVLTAVAADMEKEGVRLGNLLIEGDMRARGFIRGSEFATVVEDLFNNAIHAMVESEKKELSIKVEIGETKIFFEVDDTGCGIEEKDFDRIFDREYSTKKEGGFGLYYARATLNKYGGKIKVERSEPGKGTTMRVEVRRA